MPFLYQGYDLSGTLPDAYMDARQNQFTSQIADKWLPAIPLRGGTRDIVPLFLARKLDVDRLFRFFGYAKSALARSPPHDSMKFHSDFLRVVCRGKPCIYSTEEVGEGSSSDETKLSKGYIYGITMSRLLIQGMAQTMHEFNPRLVIFCNIETFQYGVLWFGMDAPIIQAVCTNMCGPTVPKMRFIWGAAAPSQGLDVNTAACCRVGCQQVIQGKEGVRCEDCTFQQYCSKKCRKKDRKRHQSSCIQIDKDGNVSMKGQGSKAAVASKPPNECAQCHKQESSGARLKRCACRAVYYCCVDHQKAHWPLHKAECRRIRKANEK